MNAARLIAFLLCIISFAAIAPALAASQARVTATHPSPQTYLGAQQSFWVRIAYDTDETISLWARPYRNGVEVKRAMSNASMSYVGAGEALGWFALTEPGDVDEVRVIAGGGKPYRQWELARFPLQLTWTSAPAANTSQPQWLTDLRAIEQQRRQEDAARRAQEPTSSGDVAMLNGFMLTVIGLFVACFAVPARCAWKWRGGWRIAAALPAVLMLLVALNIIIDTARDPTSHNLWPFEILQFGVVALAIVGALKLARKVTGVAA